MAALHTSTPWLPQDDYLLAYSIEHGASLESLAKGAVEFSRKFTIKELQDRWLSLLYDPAVSAEAGARMAEIESSVALLKSKKVETVLGIEKRKTESIRNFYYSRKRVCKEPLYQGDLSFLMDNSFTNEGAANCVENVLEDPLESNFGIEGSNFDGLYNLCAPDLGYDFFVDEQNTLEDPIDQNLTLDEQIHDLLRDSKPSGEAYRSDEPLYNSKDKFSDCGTSCEYLRYSSPSLPEEAVWKTMENMLLSEMPNGDGNIPNNMHIVDEFDITDGNDAGEGVSHLPSLLSNPMPFDDVKNPTTGIDGFGADVSNFNYTNGDEMQIMDERVDELEETSFDGLHTLLLNTMDYVIDDEVCSVPEMTSNLHSCSVNQASTSTPTVDPRFPEYRNGVICCVLNTEDPEIPCNDDIFPSKRPTPGGHRRSQNKATIQSSTKSFSSMNLEPKPMKKSHSTQSLDGNLDCVVNGSTEKHRVNQYESLNHNSRGTNEEYLGLYGYGVDKPGLVTESDQGQMNVGGINYEAQQIPSALDFVPPVLEEADNDLLSSEPDQFYESDADLPCFSDVESLILDLDLGPADQDPLCAAKIEKYQQEDAKKTIIRLEQNAHSHMQRDMTSHGAFAILFGRHSKHYIKKSEVLLGRATNDVHVDIDLTREGHPHKISRRQASIKMGRDGTFGIKNLGRSPIYVNGEKITNGQCFDLLSNCLIEASDYTPPKASILKCWN
ncbi:hypothetical protein KSS87_005533 [Heliosperma pusillum]|nr:hypothetical protein KSS87_005533 [Heliosperma pusillum]